MRINRVKQLWREGKPAVGGFLSIPSGFSAEVMSHTGLDWLCEMVMLISDRLAMANFMKAEVAKLTGWTPLSAAKQ